MLGLLPCHQFLDGGHHVGVAAGAQHAVHLGQFGADVIGVALGETAGDQQLFQLALFLQLSQLQNIFDGLALGGVDEAAGVEHRHVGPFRVCGDGIARLLAQGHHLLGIDQIFGAAQGNKCNFIRHVKRLLYPSAENLIGRSSAR